MRAVFCLAAMTVGCDLCAPCDPEVDDMCEVDGGPDPTPPDFCDTPEEGLMDTAHCVLSLGCSPDAGRIEFIQPADDAGLADQDWYSAEFGTLTPRSLLRISGGYIAPVSPVALSVTVLQSNAMMSLTREVDDHGAGAPKPIDIIIPFTQSNSKLLFLVADKGGRSPPVYDVRNPYFISVCTQENPDINEPNDSPDGGGTPIPLTQSGAIWQGTNTGYLATDNDVDRFNFTVMPNMAGPRQIVYLHLTTAAALTPPPPYRLSYTLYDPNGISIAEGVTANAFLQVDLATAKLVRTPGTFTVVVQGYKQNPNDPTVVPGDLRQQYTIAIQLMPDLDMEEPNDSMAEAAAQSVVLGVGSSLAATVGRLSYVPDPEWFAVDLSPSAEHSVLSVRLTASQTAGRFTPLAGNRDRQLRVLTPVAAVGAVSGPARCSADPGACPKGYDPGDQTQQSLVDRVCNSFPDSGFGQCLWLERNQNNDAMNFANLRNLQGTIPVPPAGGRYWILVGDDGNNWADDAEWTLNVSRAADTDEGRGWPIAGSVNGQVNGVISHGFGRTFAYELADCAARPQTCRGMRSPYDYDAVPTDLDTFSFTLGFGTDQAWGLEWQLDKVDGGSLPGELAINLAFCGVSLPDGGCGTLTSTVYQSGNFSPWYSGDDPDRVIGWSRVDMGSYVLIRAEANQCLCFRAAYTRFNMTLGLVDRNYYGPLTYRVNQSTGPFSAMFPGDAGIPTGCGPRLGDGGMGTYPCGLP